MSPVEDLANAYFNASSQLIERQLGLRQDARLLKAAREKLVEGMSELLAGAAEPVVKALDEMTEDHTAMRRTIVVSNQPFILSIEIAVPVM